MNIKKLLVGGIAGGITFFLLGWLFYGILLMDFMAAHSGASGNINRPEPDFIYLFIGNLAIGLLITYIFIKAGVNSLSAGVLTGAVIGLLMAIGYDSMIYATTTTMSKTGMAADVAAATVMTAITGGIVAILIGMLSKQRSA